MKLRRRHVVAVTGLALMGVLIATLWMRHIPEPSYRGIRFGVFLDAYWKDREMRKTARQAVKEMGSSVVPYLVSQIEKRPVREFMFKLKPSMPDKLGAMFPDQTAYANRKSIAAFLLTEAGTNGVSALPLLLKITEAEGPAFTHNYVRAIGMLAPGTEYEDRARQVILRVATEARSLPDRDLRRMAYHFLGTFRGDDVVAVLIDGLHDRAVAGTCIDSLIRIGTDAVPELTKVAAHERGYVRPAGLALEKIERKMRPDQQP